MEITADLREGTYAFHVDGRADDGRRVECVARFRVAVE
jgi:hypothetical protein